MDIHNHPMDMFMGGFLDGTGQPTMWLLVSEYPWKFMDQSADQCMYTICGPNPRTCPRKKCAGNTQVLRASWLMDHHGL